MFSRFRRKKFVWTNLATGERRAFRTDEQLQDFLRGRAERAPFYAGGTTLLGQDRRQP